MFNFFRKRKKAKHKEIGKATSSVPSTKPNTSQSSAPSVSYSLSWEDEKPVKHGDLNFDGNNMTIQK